MKNFLLTYFLFLYQVNFSTSHEAIIQLESITVNYVNTKWLDYSSTATPVNKTTKVLNQTTCFKFQPDDNTLVDTDIAKIAKNGKRFPLMKMVKTLEANYAMTYFGAMNVYTTYCHPQLIWPPKQHVLYHSFGWAPSGGQQFVKNLLNGKYITDRTIRFKNNTILVKETWVINLI